MRPHTIISVFSLPFLFMTSIAPAGAQEANHFQAPYRLKAGSEFVEVSAGYAGPTLFDIDRNGSLDLVVGEFDKGQVRIFLNQGMNGEPILAPHEYLMIGSERFSVPMG